MTSEEYGQLIDDFELGADVGPDETLTQYIERRRREFESKADGGSIGIEVFFGPKREDFRIGGFAQRKVPYDPRASAQDFANALKSVSAGTTYQQQADAQRYARNKANEMLTEAFRSGNINQLANQFNFKADPSLRFEKNKSGIYGLTQANRENVLKNMAQQMLSYPTGGSSAPMKKSPLQLKIEENQRIYDEYIKNNPPQLGIITGPQGGTPTPPKPEYEDQALLSKLTMLTPEEAFAGETFDTLSDLDQYNFAQAFTQFQPQLRDPTYVSPYGAPSGREIFARRYGIKDGGRVRMVSGGVLKSIGSGIMKLFGKGDDAVDLAKQEEIFRSGPITKEFLETVDSKVINPFVRTRDAKGVGSYGLYDNFDDMPAGLKAAEIIKRFVNRKTGEIDYEAAEFFIGRKLKGDETINELIDIAISKPIGSGKSANLEELMADGGRVGLFMGGDPLTGQALDIYNSMNAYGFSDQEIADALSARGLYTAAGSGTGTETTAPNIIGSQINQGGGGGGITELQETFTRAAGSTPKISEDAFFGLGKFFQGKERGTLGTRLANQPRLPLPASIVSYSMSPFNPDSKNYNPDFEDQLNFLELGDDMIGMSNTGLKYGSGSVLRGQNVISGFGSNNYLTQLNKYINRKNITDKARQKGIDERNAFLAAQEKKNQAEEQRQKDIGAAAIKRRNTSFGGQ